MQRGTDPGLYLFLAVVLPEVQPVEDVRMPGLQVDGKGALPLTAPLVHIPTGRMRTIVACKSVL